MACGCGCENRPMWFTPEVCRILAYLWIYASRLVRQASLASSAGAIPAPARRGATSPGIGSWADGGNDMSQVQTERCPGRTAREAIEPRACIIRRPTVSMIWKATSRRSLLARTPETPAGSERTTRAATEMLGTWETHGGPRQAKSG